MDLAFLFQGQNADASIPVALNADFSLSRIAGGEHVWVGGVFPGTLTSDGDTAFWPVALHSAAPNAGTENEYSEWTGWQSFGGLAVGSDRGAADALLAPAATLDLRVSGYVAPLVVTTDGTTVAITNRSEQAFDRLLLVYSHEGGIGVRVVENLPALETVSEQLGPKEGPGYLQLQVAQERLEELFLEPLGDAIGPALAAAQSVPLLETQGLRVIGLSRQSARESLRVTGDPLSSATAVQLLHAEVLEPKEADRVAALLASDGIQVADVASVLGLFAEAKLELASRADDDIIAASAASLLEQLQVQ
jgi:hypothetical protein